MTRRSPHALPPTTTPPTMTDSTTTPPASPDAAPLPHAAPYAAPALTPLGSVGSVTAGPIADGGTIDQLVGLTGGFNQVDGTS